MISKSCLLTVACVFAWNAPAPADIPSPNRKARDQENRAVAPVVIKHGAIRGEGRSVQAKIVIPRSLLPGENGGGAFGAAAPAAPAPPAPAPNDRSSTPPLGTMIAGIAMSLAAVSTVFVFRGNRATKATAMIVLAGSLAVTGFGIAQADVVGQRRPVRPPAPVESDTEIAIELTDFGESVTLHLAR